MNDYMPWIVALIIGLLSSLAAFLQFKHSRRLIEKQLDSSKEIAQLEFNKTVLSGNRQAWINKLRDELSIFLSIVESLPVIIKEKKEVGEKIYEKNFPELLKMRETYFRIELLLNPEESPSTELLEYMDQIKGSLSINVDINNTDFLVQYIDLKTKLLYSAKVILKTEWNRVKKGE